MSRLFETSLHVAAPLEEVFDFFSKAHNLERITPPEIHFHILTPDPIVMATGLIIDYRLRLFGVPFYWKTRIAEWDPPRQFADEQLKGPYALWHHTHRFEADGAGTRIHDSVRYELPWFAFGPIGHQVFVLPQIRRIFAFREQAVLAQFTRR